MPAHHHHASYHIGHASSSSLRTPRRATMNQPVAQPFAPMIKVSVARHPDMQSFKWIY